MARMNGPVLAMALIVLAVGVVAASSLGERPADANSTRKVHFTQTFDSYQNPAMGYEATQFAIILTPNDGTLYDGSVTFSSSLPVQLAVLHEIPAKQSKGQPVWSIDGKKVYGLSLLGDGKRSGSFEFTGAAIALQSATPEGFTATVSVDGWIRGQPPEVVIQKLEFEKEEPRALLARTSVPVTIPMREAMHGSGDILHIITDASDKDYARMITDGQGWRVNLAPPLAEAPPESLQRLFVFANGVTGTGLLGFQKDVFSATPEQAGYGALGAVTEVTWRPGQNEAILGSAEEIIEAEEDGRVEFDDTGIVVNAPQIVWPEGQMPVQSDMEEELGDAENAEQGDELAEPDGETGAEAEGDAEPESETMDAETKVPAQITEINTDEMTVTFVAHRAWGPDGRTIYHIITDATPSGPADTMGVIPSPAHSSMVASSAAVDSFQFQNGAKGTGLLGYQPGVVLASLADDHYTPIWRVYVVEWFDPESALLLETKSDIDWFKAEEMLSVSIARPTNSDHAVNAPLVVPNLDPPPPPIIAESAGEQ